MVPNYQKYEEVGGDVERDEVGLLGHTRHGKLVSAHGLLPLVFFVSNYRHTRKLCHKLHCV